MPGLSRHCTSVGRFQSLVDAAITATFVGFVSAGIGQASAGSRVAEVCAWLGGFLGAVAGLIRAVQVSVTVDPSGLVVRNFVRRFVVERHDIVEVRSGSTPLGRGIVAPTLLTGNGRRIPLAAFAMPNRMPTKRALFRDQTPAFSVVSNWLP